MNSSVLGLTCGKTPSCWAFLVYLAMIILNVEVVNSKGYAKKYLQGFIFYFHFYLLKLLPYY